MFRDSFFGGNMGQAGVPTPEETEQLAKRIRILQEETANAKKMQLTDDEAYFYAIGKVEEYNKSLVKKDA